MGWFKREKPVECEQAQFCITCGLHYKPRPHDEEFPSYCANCRKPHKERADRIRLVKEWAEANWGKLEPQAKKWKEAKSKRDAEIYAKIQEAYRPQNQAQMMGYGGYENNLGALFGARHGR